ncbi:rcc01693 family protein [Peteryoungia algae]|uniref:Phage tail assembly chaperone n=1 Tax=Peteryoungia algae TaxID=2919917 RepID=A0ABT0D4E6_9HYPH|nr:rcc01693 family protein [Rhizobium sp. SSM4.3]MCJ8240274.1 phage tail assembly chaperone [Rhizobium sp. SSM4.3]
MQPFPWDAAMTLGLSRLRLSPEAFWRLSLPELSAMAGAFGQPAGLSRGDVAALMRRFPD